MLQFITLFGLVVVGGATSDVAEDDVAGWKSVTRGVMIDWDLETTPLQIKVNSELGSGGDIVVRMYDDQDEIAGKIVIKNNSPPKYRLYKCTASNQPFAASVPDDQERIFTISRASVGGRIKITCNGKVLIDIQPSGDTCDKPDWEDAWSRDVAKIDFRSRDSASDAYRAEPVA